MLIATGYGACHFWDECGGDTHCQKAMREIEKGGRLSERILSTATGSSKIFNNDDRDLICQHITEGPR